MKKIVPVLLLSFSATGASAAECDCRSYPFKPNPPCFGLCVDNLSLHKDINLSTVKNIDPGVAVGIKILATERTVHGASDKGINGNTDIDFKSINGKADLERAALKSLNSRPR